MRNVLEREKLQSLATDISHIFNPYCAQMNKYEKGEPRRNEKSQISEGGWKREIFISSHRDY